MKRCVCVWCVKRGGCGVVSVFPTCPSTGCVYSSSPTSWWTSSACRWSPQTAATCLPQSWLSGVTSTATCRASRRQWPSPPPHTTCTSSLTRPRWVGCTWGESRPNHLPHPHILLAPPTQITCPTHTSYLPHPHILLAPPTHLSCSTHMPLAPPTHLTCPIHTPHLPHPLAPPTHLTCPAL